MRTAHLLGPKLSRLGCCLCGGATVAAPSQGQRTPWQTPARSIVSGGGTKRTGRPAASSVKRMPPPPPPRQQQQQTPTASSLEVHPEPLLASRRPLLDVDEIIVALTDVLVAYQKHLRACNAVAPTAPSHSNTGGGSGPQVPFYPPVPLEYLEEHFQSLLLRLLPAGVTRGDGGDSKVVRFSENSTAAEENRRQIASRIQSSGVFVFTSLQRGSVQREGACDAGGGTFFLRLRPGVRELAVDIAAFLFSLEPQDVAVRRAVPMAAIRRVSLSPTAVSFIRHELANDVRRLLLVYTHDVFAITKNGTMVQLLPSSVGGGRGFSPVTSSTANSATQKPLQGFVASAACVNEAIARTTSTEATAKTAPDYVPASFASVGEDTVVHMGRRFIAPAAVERYRLSRCLVPFLEFIPVTASVGDGSRGGTCSSSVAAGTEDGFVDFAAIRDRALAKCPNLAPLLTLDYSDMPKLRDGLLLSALSALGVECRWGRLLPPQHQHQRRHLQRPATNIGSASEMGLLFLRRRVNPQPTTAASTPLPRAEEKVHVRLLLSDLQAELEEPRMPRRRANWRKWPSHSYSVADDLTVGAAANGEETQEEDVWSYAFCRLHAAVYEELVTTPAIVTPPDPNLALALQSLSYPVGASANSAFVQHLLRQFSPRQYEQLHDILLGGLQGRVSPLFKHETEESVACLFFPYGQCDAGHGTGGWDGNSKRGAESGNEAKPEPIVFNKYVDGFYDLTTPTQLPCIRPRTLSEEPPLVYRKLLPAKVVLEILCCLHREQLRWAEEIGLEVDDDDDDDRLADNGDKDCFLSFTALRSRLQPASRSYVRDNIGDLAMIPLLLSCFPRYFRVPAIGTALSWSVIGLTREGRCLAQLLEASLAPSANNGTPLLYRSQRTGCFFTDDARQQLDAFLLWR
ncbi:uncharacterized protein Tco025E_05726 [Trypanosoma conorhini]|uniref:Uncharacterized protein n=1 Tax=Trypanosoma conorhini TaxID=83891 RepID=A0A3R7KT00_9TRYP|nr:uncharacterized protein Tco025E_05726 [Trypanosoma conorhini]RNF14745.1 hypothetical protein Tco025E_05726 [Trypanosoma conorhini]